MLVKFNYEGVMA